MVQFTFMLFGKNRTVPLASWSVLIPTYPIINPLVEGCVWYTELLSKTTNWELWLVFWPVRKPLSFVSTNYMHLKLYLMVQFTCGSHALSSSLAPTCNTTSSDLIQHPPSEGAVVVPLPILIANSSHPQAVIWAIKSTRNTLIWYQLNQYAL